jgi:phosphomannomutase
VVSDVSSIEREIDAALSEHRRNIEREEEMRRTMEELRRMAFLAIRKGGPGTEVAHLVQLVANLAERVSNLHIRFSQVEMLVRVMAARQGLPEKQNIWPDED